MYLLTGATGYVGGRLQRRLERDHLSVRCLCRDPEALRWRMAAGTEAVKGDLLEPESLGRAFADVDTAFYLVHSMHAGPVRTSIGAQPRISLARQEASVQRIVYLGGLANGDDLSPHMRSAVPEQGTFSVPAAFPVTNSGVNRNQIYGSASFEMIRALVERAYIVDYFRDGSAPLHSLSR